MSPPVRLGVLISGEGRTLQNLIDRIEDKTLEAKIEVVISSVLGALGLERARKAGIPAVTVDRKAHRGVRDFSEAVSQALEPYPLDLVLMAGFIHLYLLPPRWRGRVLNIHPALLPEFGGKGFYGRRVHEAVIQSGARESGCTVHFADSQYDHGPIILQRRVPVLPQDTPESLAERVFQEECAAYPEAIRRVVSGRIVPSRASLKGHVDILGLGNLLQSLSMNKREGMLTVRKGTATKILHFRPDGIRILSSNMKRINELGKILLRQKKIGADDLHALLREQARLGWKLGKIAVTRGLVKKQEIEKALQEQIEEEIFDLFMWQDATFEFVDSSDLIPSTPDPLADLTIESNITTLVLEAARRADELLHMRRLLSDDDMVLQKFPFDIQAEELGEDLEAADAVLPLILGHRTLGEILRSSIYPRFSTLRAIYKLLCLGYVKGHDRQGHTIRMPLR